MQKLGTKSLLLIALSIFATQVSAVNIQNFTITPNGQTYIQFSWEQLANSDIDQESAYGLQWNKDLSKIKIDAPTDARIPTTKSTFEMLRGSDVFEKNTDYYARVYGFYRGDMQRKNYLTKGSKILKFKWLSNGNVETSYIEPNDPTVIADNATTTVAKNFQRITATPYDTSVQLSWSRTNDVFDDYVLVLATESTLANPIREFTVKKAHTKALLTGLEAGKKYFIAGYLKRNGRTYGKGQTINFTTLPKFDAYKQDRFKKYVLDKKRYGELLSTGAAVDNTPAVTTTTTSSSSAEIKSRISELKKLIAKYSSELKKLEGKVNPAKKRTLSGRRTIKRRSGSLQDRFKNRRARR